MIRRLLLTLAALSLLGCSSTYERVHRGDVCVERHEDHVFGFTWWQSERACDD